MLLLICNLASALFIKVKQFDSAKNKMIEFSEGPKKDGEEICSKLDEIKEAFQTELKVIFEKLEKKLCDL